uniref:Prickle-like protein 2 n=1 Tax=Strongyloides venezuelensis TaxID=75913 RepID=A0A0K0EXJ0_STRVS
MNETQTDILTPYFKRLELKPKHIIAHEYGAGSRCLNCSCPGLDLHFWRKMCKSCNCRMDEHDIVMPLNFDHGALIRKLLIDRSNPQPSRDSENFLNLRNKISTAIFRKNEHSLQTNTTISTPSSSINYKTSNETLKEPLYGKINKSNNNINGINNSTFIDGYRKSNNTPCINNENDRQVPEYTWLPQGLPEQSIVEYMNSIPENDRPLVGTDGEQVRRTKLAYQLPYHDSDPTACKSLQKEGDIELHRKFVEKIKNNVVGVGEVIDRREFKNCESQTQNDVSCQTNNYQNVDCYNCNNCLSNSNVIIDTSKGPGKNVFHPKCFKCEVCNQLLVDLLYFFHNDKYYCGRHYGEQIYSRCFGCDELIFQNEYTFAEGKNWHIEHFCCFGCDMSLGGHKYCVKDEKPYCITCYMNKFAKRCETCSQKIPPDQERLTHSDLNWHATPQCFKCFTCLKSLKNSPFMLKSNKLFCSGICRNNFKE